MTDLEKVIVEIERRREINFNVSQQCRLQEDDEIISYIKTLIKRRKEPVEEGGANPSLIEKATRWFDNIVDECQKLTTGNVSHIGTQIKGMAKRSAEYLRRHKDDPTNTDFKKELNEWCRYTHQNAIVATAVHFANWQKEQLMKEREENYNSVRNDTELYEKIMQESRNRKEVNLRYLNSIGISID